MPDAFVHRPWDGPAGSPPGYGPRVVAPPPGGWRRSAASTVRPVKSPGVGHRSRSRLASTRAFTVAYFPVSALDPFRSPIRGERQGLAEAAQGYGAFIGRPR